MNKYTPECPFCGRNINRPEDIKTEFGSVSGGSCLCGAVYVCDPTGHNTGEAYMEALALAKGNWQIGAVEEDVDYETADYDYDEKSHQQVYSGGLGNPAGHLIFIKMKGKAGKSLLPVKAGPVPDIAGSGTTSSRSSKGRIKELLESRDLKGVAEMARQDRGVIKWLISLAYDKDDVISWLAIESVGVISKQFSKDMMEILRDTVRRLLWSMGEESGGIGWSAAEMLGEIVSGDPDAFSDIVPILWSFKEEDMFRAGILWAMGRISIGRPDLTDFIATDLPGLMRDANPLVRAYAARAAGILDAAGCNDQISRLADDNSPVVLYRDGELAPATVGEIAREILNK